MLRFGYVLAALLLTAGCRGQRDGDETAYQSKNLGQKPVVAIVPMMDHTLNYLPWSLSEEFTLSIRHRLQQKDFFYLVDQQSVNEKTKQLSNGQNPFGKDLSWMKKFFFGNEFVVFMELIEHTEVPVRAQKLGSSSNTNAELNMTIRLEIVDLRESTPRVVLQELVQESHFIPKPFTQSNFTQVAWGMDGFNVSPMGIAHAQMIKEITLRIQDYILIAKANL